MLHPSTVPPNSYLPKHYHNCRLKCAEMSLNEFTEFMECIRVANVQWVVEWWRISSMVHHSLKDNCVPLVGFYFYSYYSTGHIARQFGDHQGAPSDDGSSHTLAFTDRTLGTICKSWSRWRVTNDIRPP